MAMVDDSDKQRSGGGSSDSAPDAGADSRPGAAMGADSRPGAMLGADSPAGAGAAPGGPPTGADDPTEIAPAAQRRPVNWRSLLLGLIGVGFICGLTPYNDFVVANTYLVGNFLPIGLLMFFLVFILAINVPLRAIAPRLALHGGELAVSLGMVMVSCALPSSGLMRYLPAYLVSIPYHAPSSPDFQKVLKELDLPKWVFPTFEEPDALLTGRGDVIQRYRTQAFVEEPTFRNRFNAVPWRAWATPAVSWGILLAAMYGAIGFAAIVVRRQWVDNERLPFPLASVYLSLIETPPAGKVLNSLFSSKGFWAAFAVVFFIHGFNALSQYLPQYFPEIPLRGEFGSILTHPPLSDTEWGFKTLKLFFSIAGITYFLQSGVAFSLWFFYILYNVAQMYLRANQSGINAGHQIDQMFGASLVFVIVILWIGRHHWWLILRQMVRGARDDEPRGRYLPYWFAGWGLLTCVAVMVGWLVVAGTTLIGGIVIVAMILGMFLVIARIVCETGLAFVQVKAPATRPWIYLLNDIPGVSHRTTDRNFFFSAMFNGLFSHDMREAFSVYATQSLKVADDAAYAGERNWRRAVPFVIALALAMVVGFIVAGGSTLFVEYSFGAQQDVTQRSPINGYGVDSAPRDQVLDPVRTFMLTTKGVNESHNRMGNVVFGAAVVGVLSAMRLRFAAWPLHPVGYLLAYSYPMQTIWFSIFVGWLAKVLIVRFGGSSIFRAARPLFIGLIVGEAGAAGFWLIVSLILNALGMDYQAISLLPG